MSNPGKLKRLRMLPPIAIARFGSSPIPMQNYDLRVPRNDEEKPTTDYRRIFPAETLVVDDATGAIARAELASEVRFRDSEGRIKPVCPFFEVWVEFEDSDEMVPLTANHLAEFGLTPASLVWSVRAANLKVVRRTGHARDMVQAEIAAFSDNETHPLLGHCPNFKPGKTIQFGTIRCILPTPEFPEIRARFTPGQGLVFGPREGDPLVSDDVYAGATAKAPGSGRWDRYYIGNPGAPFVTAPGDIFQGEDIGLNGDSKLSSGYFDDTCDGIIQVALSIEGRTLTAYARFASAVPDFAPDSLPVRSISDDIEQMALGPTVAKPSDDEERAALATDVQDILRRALDTVRQINTVALNGDEPVADVQRFRNNMPGQQTGYNRLFEPIFEKELATYPVALGIHKSILKAAIDAPNPDTAFAGRFGKVRQPEDVANLDDAKRRLMPAMMRGNEGLELALTRRQIAKLALADPTSLVAAAPAVAAAAGPAVVPRIDMTTVNRPVRRRVQVPGEGR